MTVDAEEERPRHRLRVGVPLGIAWLVLVGLITLVPEPVVNSEPTLSPISFCVVCGERGTADAILNVVLFLPLGLLLARRRRRVFGPILAGFLLSGSIEALQFFIPGRYTTLGDVVWNTVGAGLGALLASRVRDWLPGSERRLWPARASVFLAGVSTLLFGVLMRPAWPLEPYWGQWTPDLGWMPQYDGAVMAADLDSLPIPPGRFPRGTHPRQLLFGDWHMDATVVKGSAPRAVAPILNLYNGNRVEVTMLGALRQDLVYRERTRSRVFRLDGPDFRWPGVLAASAVGDTVELGVRRSGTEGCLLFDGATSCSRLTPGRAWSLLLYLEGPTDVFRRAVDALWMFFLFLPVGLWSRGIRRLGVRALVAFALVVGAAALTDLSALPALEALAGVTGVFAGYLGRILTRHLTRAAPDPAPA